MTKLILLLSGLGLAQLTWISLPVGLIGYLSGIAGPFCMVCAAAIWSMREKAEAAFDPDFLGADQFRRSIPAFHELRRRSMVQASVAALGGLAAISPAVSLQVSGAIWHWMTLAAGVGIARAAFGYLLAAEWERQIIAHRHALIQRRKDREEAQALEAAIENAKPHATAFPGWTEVGGSLRPPSPH